MIEEDIACVAESLRNSPELFETEYVIRTLSRRGCRVIPSPYSDEIPAMIVDALGSRSPLSVIRLGDSEINLMCYGRKSSTTPDLDYLAATKSIETQEDRFSPSDKILRRIRDDLWRSVRIADIIGTLGVWSPVAYNFDISAYLLRVEPRGLTGQIRGRQFTLSLPDKADKLKIVTSAHLYAGVIMSLSKIIEAAAHITLITNRTATVENIRRRFAHKVVDHFQVGGHDDLTSASSRAYPGFLKETKRKISRNSSGRLYLVGAGIWSEIYCMWIKQSGGVAVDLGSGFDLLAGLTTREVHRYIEFDGKSISADR